MSWLGLHRCCAAILFSPSHRRLPAHAHRLVDPCIRDQDFPATGTPRPTDTHSAVRTVSSCVRLAWTPGWWAGGPMVSSANVMSTDQVAPAERIGYWASWVDRLFNGLKCDQYGDTQ